MKFFHTITVTEPFPPPSLAVDRCLWQRWHSCGCRRCIDNCPQRALELADGILAVNQAACSSCMRCTAVCPNDALLPVHGGHDLINTLVGRDSLLISCIRQPRMQTEEHTVHCLGQFTDEALLAIVLLGPPVVRFNTAACKTCVNSRSAAAGVDTLKRLQQLLGSASRTTITFLEEYSAASDGTTGSRRDFFDALKNMNTPSGAGIGSGLPDEQEPIDNRRRIPRRRRLFLKLWERIDAERRELLRTTCFPRLRRSKHCEPCPRCSGICPTGALVLDDEGAVEQLMFDGRLCTACGLCTAFCPEQVLSLTYPLLSEQRVGEPGYCDT